ncbi:hypothetical protein SLA2020_526470 [Shorea laevis]
MEDGMHMNQMGIQGSLMIKTDAKSYDDVMNRRLKNRERQRKYRARKRLEADIQKSHVLNQSTVRQVSLQHNDIVNNCMKRVHCKRDWKKDARRAHICRGQEDTSNFSVQPAIMITAESQILCPSSGIKVDGMLERELHSDNSCSLGNFEVTNTKPGPRDWKADARKKKT